MTDLFFYTHNSYLAAFFPHDLHIKNRELLKKKKNFDYLHNIFAPRNYS